MAVDLWNARGEDVGSSSQLGYPAITVFPRVSGSGKTPHGSRKQTAGANLTSTGLCVGGSALNLLHRSRRCFSPLFVFGLGTEMQYCMCSWKVTEVEL